MTFPTELSRRHVLATATLTTACAVSTAGCLSRSDGAADQPTTLRGDWPSAGRDAGNTGFLDQSVPSSFVEDWATTGDPDATFVASPIVVSDTVYVGIEDGLVAYDAQRGLNEWSVGLDGATAATPAAADGSVFVPQDGDGAWFTPGGATDHARLVAVHAGTGDRQWERRLDTGRIYSPSVSDGSVFLRTTERPYAIDASTGSIEWTGPELEPLRTRRIRHEETAAPAVGDEVVIYPTRDGVTALDRSDGEVVWDLSSGAVFSGAAFHDGTVYVPTESELVAVDSQTGERRWSSEGTYLNSPAVDGEHVYTSDHQGVVAHDGASGAERWTITDLGESWTSPVCTRGSLLVGGSSAAMRVVDLDAQRVQWSFDGDAFTYSDLAVGGGGVYVLTGSASGRPTLRSLSDRSTGPRQDGGNRSREHASERE